MPRSITASMLYDMVDCPHRVTMDAHADAADRDPASPFLAMLRERGVAHEASVVEALGIDLSDLSEIDDEAREAATLAAMDAGAELIYAGRISVDDLVGMPDLLRRDGDGYMAGDIKSGAGLQRGRPRRSYAMQLALYADILERTGRGRGHRAFVIDGSGDEACYDLDAPPGQRGGPTLWQAYRSLLGQARDALADASHTRPALGSACKQCAWRSACTARLEEERDLTLLPEVGRAARDAICARFPDLPSLAGADPDTLEGVADEMPGVSARKLRRAHERAVLRCEANPRAYRRAAITLPAADIEVFFDVEDDPLREICYLHGFVERVAGGVARYHGFFADGEGDGAEAAAFADAWRYLAAMTARGAAVYHYGAYERTTWRGLQARFPAVCSVAEVEALFARPQTVDLYTAVVRPHTEWPTRDFSIKSIATYLGFSWRDDDPSGASSIQWYDDWLRSGDTRLRDRILAYNEDDCRATAVVLDAVRSLPARGQRAD